MSPSIITWLYIRVRGLEYAGFIEDPLSCSRDFEDNSTGAPGKREIPDLPEFSFSAGERSPLMKQARAAELR